MKVVLHLMLGARLFAETASLWTLEHYSQRQGPAVHLDVTPFLPAGWYRSLRSGDGGGELAGTHSAYQRELSLVLASLCRQTLSKRLASFSLQN